MPPTVRPAAEPRGGPFPQAMAMESIKLRSLRSTRWTLLLAALLAAGLTVLFSGLAGSSGDLADLSAVETSGVPLLVLCYGAGYRVRRRGHLYAWLAGYVAVAVATVVASWRLGAHALWAVVIAQVAWLVLLVVLPGLIGQYRAQRHALVAAWRDRAERPSASG